MTSHGYRQAAIGVAALVSAGWACLPSAAVAQAPCNPASLQPAYRSFEALADGRATFRLCAPDAHDVLLTSGDLPAMIPDAPTGGLAMSKDATGLWSTTLPRPAAPGTYQFSFRVDGVPTPDPMGHSFVRNWRGVGSTFTIEAPAPSRQTWDPAIPHGASATIDYWSSALKIARRARIYTPPGYMKGGRSYPVLYLVHGAGGSEESWSTVGRVNIILDALIAAGTARPMIVVMPDGTTPLRPGVQTMDNPDFGEDLTRDLIPLIDATYRTLPVPDMRAMAGLSMGGSHTLRNGLTHPDLFHWIGIFSMGLGQANDPNPDRVGDYTRRYDAALRQDASQLKLLYYAMGRDDFLYPTASRTRAMFDRYGLHYVYHESDGGHTWVNWRAYLEDFAPRIFREAPHAVERRQKAAG